jgi:hypothetical protein
LAPNRADLNNEAICKARHQVVFTKTDSNVALGIAWSNAVEAYSEKASYCHSRGLYGIEGMHQFWSEYARICDDLAASSRLHNLVIDVHPGKWERYLGEVESFLDSLGMLQRRKDET